ncbi:MAG: hypothetical protein ACXVYI_07110 [Mycobacterium sp.]
MSGFVDHAHHHSDDRPPYTDLEHCQGNEEHFLRRLLIVLEQVMGTTGEIYKGGVATPSGELFLPGVNVKFPPNQVAALQRVGLWLDSDKVCLAGWPCELAPQYKRVYSDPKKVEALTTLSENHGWELRPGFHLAYRFAAPTQRWYPSRHLSGPQYARQWIDDARDNRAKGRNREQLQDPSFRRWLVERGYADDDDLATLDDWLNKRSSKTPFHIRPGMRIRRAWPLEEAVGRDRAGAFVTDVRRAIDQILAALGEPPIGVLKPSQ